MGLFKKKKSDKKISFKTSPFLKKLKPKEKYIFHSDYFEIDSGYATILSYFHKRGAHDKFDPFWGIGLIPTSLPRGCTTLNFEQVERLSEGWVSDHQTKAESITQSTKETQRKGGSESELQRAETAQTDLSIIASELNNGASYLNVQSRLLLKAPTLEILDKAVDKIERLYYDRFGTIWAAPYTGEQRQELTNILNYNKYKRGKGFYYTSTEYTGAYSLVTQGLMDPGGEYVGYMTGDVNNSAVLFDVNKFYKHVVVASEQYNSVRDRAFVADMWGSKIAQSALMNNNRIIHIILNNANMDNLGPKFENITQYINMNKGDVNMFEMFGTAEDELTVYPAHKEKLILMAEQAYDSNANDRAIIRGALGDVLDKFYIDNKMWVENAKHNRDKIRVVGLKHSVIPKLEMFVSYLAMEHKAALNASTQDNEHLHALKILYTTFKNLLTSNGDLFNTITSDEIDGVETNWRTVYDFSGLMRRGKGVAMAQLVNIIGFATQSLNQSDLLIIHGAQFIDPGIRDYINTQFEHLFAKGGRVAYLYTDMEKFLKDKDFNNFDKANYTILGNMSNSVADRYQKLSGHIIPMSLASLITTESEAIAYVRRGFDNVVFRQDLYLDVD